ncbi:chemotaxis protein CheW [Roseibacterium sp. SDUM158017]|uniref:chemotaxis protein CheW n=1 Tax=Roseicyclus salinarum TaxID=3036773 RepID=UPI00241591D0|nr:chemotaxis protein CheW [Roseibacterium sp. SDUM158017]MDG4648410.1 chemotaxis protein CheW [Roseibacterium sp. SDUM158017]
MTGSGSRPDAVPRFRTIGLLQVGDDLVGVPSDALLEVTLIRRLDRILSPEPAVIGALTLRGTLVPVCDPFVLCELGAQGAGRPIAAIVTDGKGMIALGVDGISGLRRCEEGNVQRLHGAEMQGVLDGQAILDGQIVHLLDIERIFANARLPRAERKLRRVASTGNGDGLKHLTFRSGGVLYALSAEHIFGTVPRQDIEERWLGERLVSGCIRFHGRRIPVIEPHELFGLGTPRAAERPEFVVIRMPGERVLALAVDEVCSIQHVGRATRTGREGGMGTRSDLLRGTHDDGGSVVFLLDAARILANATLLNISELSDRSPVPIDDGVLGRGAGPGAVAPSEQGIIRERVRSLVFVAGQRFAAPITQVARILEMPERLTSCETDIAGLLGLFLVGGQPAPLVDLAGHLGLPPSRRPVERRVLLIGPPQARIGIVVEGIDGIADSDWRSRPEARMPGGHDMVQLRRRGEVEVLDRLDLDAVADGVRAAWLGAVPEAGERETADAERLEPV